MYGINPLKFKKNTRQTFEPETLKNWKRIYLAVDFNFFKFKYQYQYLSLFLNLLFQIGKSTCFCRIKLKQNYGVSVILKTPQH